jgi:DNA-binding PadR family transcriptional regulator
MTAIDFNGLDTVVHGPLRLGVLTQLQVEGPLDFTTLKQRLAATDGLIGSHLQKLEEAGYVTSSKSFVKRRPKTIYAITRGGRKALAAYLAAMQQVIDLVEGQRPPRS